MEKIKVFVVDDSVAARNMLIRVLAGADDIEVAGEAGSGQAGIIMLKEIKPDVVLLEASVGGGLSLNNVVKEIKNMDRHIKIILCSDAIHLEKVMPATEYGAFDFVRKPYQKQNLLRAIREAAAQ